MRIAPTPPLLGRSPNNVPEGYPGAEKALRVLQTIIRERRHVLKKKVRKCMDGGHGKTAEVFAARIKELSLIDAHVYKMLTPEERTWSE